MALDELFLVLDYLSIEFVGQCINCGIQVVFIGICENLRAADMNRRLGLVNELFY